MVNGTFSELGGVGIGARITSHAPNELHIGLISISLHSFLPVGFIASGIAYAGPIMLPQFSEVRKVDPISTIRILRCFGSSQPLFGQVGGFIPRIRSLRPPSQKKDSSFAFYLRDNQVCEGLTTGPIKAK